MSIKDKRKSIQFKLFFTLCISIILIISLIVIVNNVLLETFYKFTKIETAKSISNRINEYYNTTLQFGFENELRDIEIKNNIQILIQNQNKEVIYTGNKDILNLISRSIVREGNLIYKKDNTEVRQNSINDHLLLISTLDNGYTVYIRIPITPIKESVNISNRTLIIIAVIMFAISAIFSSLYSKQFTKPIVELNNITKKMAKLDFSEKYKITNANDEINTLGKNINEMSEKLETTIGRLRENNNELEKDIEEKSRIDEMRKQFISDVSHELKTPISLIQGYAEGLKEDVNSDEESRKFYADVIIDESNKMDKLVKQLLELMKLEYKEMKFEDRKFDLNELINEEIKRQTVILKEKNIVIEFDGKKKCNVFASTNYIEQIVNNYLTNAIKHCEERNNEKKIIIRTEKTKDKKIRLYIYNTGKKIPKENMQKIWKRFYKEDTSRNREERRNRNRPCNC